MASSATSQPPLQRLRALTRLEKGDVRTIIAFGVVTGLLSLATPLAIQVLINWLAFGSLLQPIFWLGGGLLAVLSLAAWLQVLQRMAVEAVERRLFLRAVSDLSSRLPRADVRTFDTQSPSDLANRFFDVLTLQKAAATLLLDGLNAILQVLVAIALLAVYHPWLLVYDLVLIFSMIALVFLPARRGEASAIVESKAKYAMAHWIEEVMRRGPVLRQGSDLATQHAEELSRYWLKAREKHFRVFLLQLSGARVFQVLASVGLLILTGSLVLRGELTIGQLVAAEFIVAAAVAGFLKFADKLDTVYDLLAGLDKLGQLVDLPGERSVGAITSNASSAKVELEHIQLHKDDPSTSFVIPAGAKMLLYAPRTSGRSPLAEVAVGLRTPESGIVRRDGTSHHLMKADALHESSMLLRADGLLEGSIRQNLTLGRRLPDHELLEALRDVGMMDELDTLADGLDTQLQANGAPLTPADVRALLVARALLDSPQVLVVDGLLDNASAAERARLLNLLMTLPSTTLVLTSQPSDYPSLTPLVIGGFDVRRTSA